MRSALRTFLADILGITAAAVTIYLFWREVVGELGDPATVGVTFIGGFATYFFLAHVFTRGKWERKAKYAELLERLNAGFEEVHDLNRNAEDASPREIRKGFRILCDNLAEGLSQVTNAKCHVCVKVLKFDRSEASDTGEVQVQTLCRDELSARNRRSADEKTRDNDVSHRVEENSAFRKCLSNLEGRFVSNRLPLLPGYTNTSHKLYGEYPASGPPGGLFVRYWRWKLPYRSTIVVPVTPPHGKNSPFRSKEIPDVVGFLCVDSPKMGVFRDEYDTEVMKGVADGMYNALTSLKEKLETRSE